MTSCSYSTCKYHRFRVQAHTGLLRYPQGRSPGCHWWLSCASAWGRPGRWTASPWSRTASWSPAHQEQGVIWWSWCETVRLSRYTDLVVLRTILYSALDLLDWFFPCDCHTAPTVPAKFFIDLSMSSQYQNVTCWMRSYLSVSFVLKILLRPRQWRAPALSRN